MPTRDQPITTASGRHIRKPITPDVKHRRRTQSSDLLPFLSDIIWLPKPFDDEAISFGDLILAVGICELAYFSSRRRYTRGPGKPEDEATPAAEAPDAATPVAGTPEAATPDAEVADPAQDADPAEVADAGRRVADPAEVADRSPGRRWITAEAQRTGTRAPRRSRTRSRAPSTRPS